MSLAPGSLPDATPGMPYAQAITAAGGTAPHTFSVTVGALPSGLTLSPNGVLTGTPTVPGVFDFVVTAVDANGCRVSHCYTLRSGTADIPALSPWMLLATLIALVAAGWAAAGRGNG
jgi:hypothetical protein